jgi:hypothetical protein
MSGNARSPSFNIERDIPSLRGAYAEQQVNSDVEAVFGNSSRLIWPWGSDIVPPNKILEITTLSLAYFPTEGGTVGRADIAGRDSSNTAVWRVQVVYVEPKKTVHLTFRRD